VVRDGIRQGLNAVIVNPSVIFGPGDWSKGSSSFFSAIDSGMPFYTGGVTGYVDVRDVVKAMILLMNNPVSGERFIISSENLSYHDVFKMISQSIGAVKPFIPIPEMMLYPAFLLLRLISFVTGKKSAITPETLHNACSKVYFDNSKVIKSTGIQFIPIKVSVEDAGKIFTIEKAKKQSS
jgi:nucleoside-diphosphate-sugar epimerase